MNTVQCILWWWTRYKFSLWTSALDTTDYSPPTSPYSSAPSVCRLPRLPTTNSYLTHRTTTSATATWASPMLSEGHRTHRLSFNQTLSRRHRELKLWQWLTSKATTGNGRRKTGDTGRKTDTSIYYIIHKQHSAIHINVHSSISTNVTPTKSRTLLQTKQTKNKQKKEREREKKKEKNCGRNKRLRRKKNPQNNAQTRREGREQAWGKHHCRKDTKRQWKKTARPTKKERNEYTQYTWAPLLLLTREPCECNECNV